jgi:DNA repair protein RadC
MRYRIETYTVESLARETPAADATVLRHPGDAARIAREVMRRAGADADREHFVVLALDARNRVRGYKVVSVGTQSACLVHPREVFQAAIALGAAAIIVAHNHPSGDVEASLDDRELTRRLQSGGDLLGIPVVESLVIDLESAAYRTAEPL